MGILNAPRYELKSNTSAGKEGSYLSIMTS